MIVRFLFVRDYDGSLWLEVIIQYASGKKETQRIELDGEPLVLTLTEEA